MMPPDAPTFDVLSAPVLDALRAFLGAFADHGAAGTAALRARLALRAACESGDAFGARAALGEAFASLFVEGVYLRQRHARLMDECAGAPSRVALLRVEVLRQTAKDAAAVASLLTHAAAVTGAVLDGPPGQVTP